MKALTVAMSDWLREEAEEANLVCLNLTGNEVSHSDLEDIRLFKEYMHRIGSMNFYDWNTSAFRWMDCVCNCCPTGKI
ncbi:MAG: hypothetical protein V8T44_06535 [Odoribacter splanchnicus]